MAWICAREDCSKEKQEDVSTSSADDTGTISQAYYACGDRGEGRVRVASALSLTFNLELEPMPMKMKHEFVRT